MTSMLRRRLHRVRTGGDAGFSLVLVMGMTGAILGLIAVVTLNGTRALRSGAAHVNFESALSAAEAGVDTTLQTISATFNNPALTLAQKQFSTAAPCALTAPATFSGATAERTWARDALQGLPASCLKQTPAGEFVAVRPTNKQAVYSMGWFPTRSSERAKKRLLKAEYVFAPYKPTNAVLTNGNLDFSGSVAVNAVGGAVSADVHTNSNITGVNGSTSIQGTVSASGSVSGCGGSVTGGCTSTTPQQAIPLLNARTLYESQRGRYPTGWFDLCPGGDVRGPAATGALPCTGTVLAPAGGYNGWQWTAGSGTTAPKWTLPRTAGGPYPGAYYVYQGDAQLGDNGNSNTLWQVTVLAEAKPTGGTATSCGKLGGNITWKLFNMTPYLPGLQLLADANLTGNANNDAGTGLFLAGDKIDLNTSSATLNGAVVAGNQCPAQGSNTIQGVTINYDDTVEAPLTDVIRTSLWLEYPAG